MPPFIPLLLLLLSVPPTFPTTPPPPPPLLSSVLPLPCTLSTISHLFTVQANPCTLCEILTAKLGLFACQIVDSESISRHHRCPERLITWNVTTNSIHWEKIFTPDKPIMYRVAVPLLPTYDDHEPTQVVVLLTFPSYPTPLLLPPICSQRKSSKSPFGHTCQRGEQCTQENDNYICTCPQSESCTKTWLLRKILEWIQIVCIVVCCLLCLIIYWLRKTKVMSVAMWPVTEGILIGSTLLYTSVILKIEPISDDSSALLCIVEPWTREVGFTLVYGGVVLKVYRSLVEFRTRKAHRWVVREKDILRYLITMTCVVVFYMTSWTVTNTTTDEDVLDYCPVTRWHRVTEGGELLFLLVGLNMAWHLRRAPVSPFKGFYTAALLLETTAHVLFLVIRETRWIIDDDEEQSEETFLMVLHFVRCQLTTTVVVGVVIGPKLYYIRDEKRKRQLRRGETTSSGGGGNVAGVGIAAVGAGRKALEAAINNGDLDFADINIADMDPQDIRLELKRVYTQLELLRNKTMRKDNPHISKRRGGRKPTHRRFSLQKKGSREKALRRNQNQQQQQYQQQHQQQQPYYQQHRSFRGQSAAYHDDMEDSVCSIEGPSTYSEAGR